MPLLFKIFDLPSLNNYRANIFEVFDQHYNSPLNEPTLPVWATKRDLSKVLNHHKCKEYGFDLHNTVMIDSDLIKVKDYPKNSIVIKPYEESELRKPTEDQSKILLEVRDYVYAMLEDCNDVRTYLKTHRPAFQLWENGQLSASANHEEGKEEESKQSDSTFSSQVHKKLEVPEKKVTSEPEKEKEMEKVEEIAQKLEETKLE